MVDKEVNEPCICVEWHKFLRLIVDFVYVGYRPEDVFKAKVFTYCPWCKVRLKEEEDA